MRREWTKEEVHRLKLLADGKVSADYIAKLLNRSITSVKSKAQWLNLSLVRRLKKKGK
jgi:predicted transcriptional regulator